MKLVFCWIEEYKNIKEQGFNFGSEYIFEVIKKSNTLEISAKENEAFIADFFTVDSNGFDNITAIVGENGVGKSNLLKLFIEIFNDQNTYIDFFKKKSKNKKNEMIFFLKYLIILQNEKGDYSILNNTNYEILNPMNIRWKVLSNFPSHNTIYYNPILDFSIFPSQFDSLKYVNISSNWLLHSDAIENNYLKEYFDQATIHKFQNTYRLLDFFNDSDLKKKIKLPDEV